MQQTFFGPHLTVLFFSALPPPLSFWTLVSSASLSAFLASPLWSSSALCYPTAPHGNVDVLRVLPLVPTFLIPHLCPISRPTPFAPASAEGSPTYSFSPYSLQLPGCPSCTYNCASCQSSLPLPPPPPPAPSLLPSHTPFPGTWHHHPLIAPVGDYRSTSIPLFLTPQLLSVTVTYLLSLLNIDVHPSIPIAAAS